MQWQHGNMGDLSATPNPTKNAIIAMLRLPHFSELSRQGAKFSSNFNSAAGSFSSDLPLEG